jgi:hypothetical protein
LASIPGFIFLLGLVIALVGFRGADRVKPRVLWLLVPFLYLSVSSARSLPFGWLALIPLLALAMTGVDEPGILRTESRGRAVVNATIALAVVAMPFVLARDTNLDPTHFPIGASQALTAERVFHDDTTGGYLIYAYGPGRQVYIDDRAELFGDRIAHFIETRNARGDWESELEEARIEEALLKKTDPLAEALERSGWEETFTDDVFVVLKKT